MRPIELSSQPLKVINLGIEGFARDLSSLGVHVQHVDWKPGIEVSKDALSVVKASTERIEAANAKALEIIQSGRAVLLGLDLAAKVIPGMHENLILHAGPPVTWERMCGPMRGAVIGALIYEGKADSYEAAEALAASGEIEFSPCHEHSTVGPMAGIVSSRMPVFIVQNEVYGNYAYCTQNEGLGKVLRYGAYAPEVLQRLIWMEQTMYPLLDKAIRSLGKIDLSNLIMQALQMGDEVHNRNRAGSSLLFRQLAPALVRCGAAQEDIAKVLEFINGNDHFFLNLSMPACKAIMDAAAGIQDSSIVTVMARNGTDFGIRLSGTGTEWFTGPALVPDALYFPGFSKEDANPDIGDSAITETGALGGFAIAAAPAIVQFVGGNAADALRYTHMMYEITLAENRNYQIPGLDFRGTPTGIDVRKVIETGICPFIDTGVAHKNAGIGQVGAGVVEAPQEPFIKALQGLAKQLKAQITAAE